MVETTGPKWMNCSGPHVTLVVIILWYASNILVILGNKYLLSHSGFNRPVFLTLCHMIACLILGSAATVVMPLKRIKSSVQFFKVALLATIFCATILLGNASLQYLPVSFNQAIGATTPFFTALLAFFLQAQREHYLTYFALLPVMAGVVIGSGGEPHFHMLGFILCMSATAGRALKSVVQSMLMTDASEKLDPMSLLVYMSAVCAALLVPVSMILEPTALMEAVAINGRNPQFLKWMIANAVLAYLTNLLNFLVTKHTSALTLQVLGNAKGVVAAGVSVLVFKNKVTAQGMLGYAITVFGVFMYSTAKRRFQSHTKRPGAGANPAEAGAWQGAPGEGHGTTPRHTAMHLSPATPRGSQQSSNPSTFPTETQPLLHTQGSVRAPFRDSKV